MNILVQHVLLGVVLVASNIVSTWLMIRLHLQRNGNGKNGGGHDR